MASGQRAFAQKLNKRGASEVRKQVSSACLSDLPKSISGLNLAIVQTVPLSDVVEPPDFEDFLVHHQGTLDRDPMRHLLDYPGDDLSVEVLRRKVRTIAPIIPERGAESDLHVKDCLRCYTKDYTVIHRGYEDNARQHWKKAFRDRALEEAVKQEYEVDMVDTGGDHDKDLSERPPSFSLDGTPRGSWASSIFDLKNSQADQLLPKLLDNTPSDEIDQHNVAQRRLNRCEALFSLYQQEHEDDQLERRPEAPIPTEHFGHRLMIKCLQLRLDLEIEPIFASLALYDAKEKKKISENFYFDVVPEPIKKMLGMHIPYQDVSSLSRSCIVSMSNPSPDIFFVIKLEKVLQQGDISDVVEPYFNEKDKNKEKAKASAVQFCDRLGAYRMPFAWTAIQMLTLLSGASSLEREPQRDDNRADSLDRRTSLLAQYDSFRKKIPPDSFIRHGSLERQKATPDKRSSWNAEEIGFAMDNLKPITLTINSFFKQESDKLTDEDLYKFLQDLKKPSSGPKKLKSIPGLLKLDVLTCPEVPRYSMTPELYKIDPFPDDKGRPVKELVEFPVKEVYQPHCTYRNLLFVYPKSLNFSNRQGSARNIAVKVEFLEAEDDAHGMPVIFGKSSCPELRKEAYTTVTYHSKSPDFYEEVKVRLPARLGDQHHLLFTFYHISCQAKPKDRDALGAVETPIGYTWLPLMQEGRLLVGDFSLPVSQERLPRHYSALHPDVQLPNMKWVDNHKGLFNVEIKADTSIHTQDARMDFFLKLVHAAEEHKIPPRIGEINFETELKRSIGELTQAKPGPVIRFLTLITDKLLQLMVRPPVIGGQLVNTGQTTFEALAQIVKMVKQTVESKNDQHGRNALLTSYVQYSCSLPHPDLTQQSPGGVSGGAFSALSRPHSLPVAGHLRSHSDMDLGDLNSPDDEVAGLLGLGRGPERAGSFRQQDGGMYRGPNAADKKLVHEELAYQWAVSVGSTKELALTNAWFFFEVMAKSMGEHLGRTERLGSYRKGRFPTQFLDDLVSLVKSIIKEIVDRYNKDFFLMRGLNTSLAFFINDCLSLMDRGFVFKLIKYYCKPMCERIASLPDAHSAILLKLDFLRIVCSHEHYVTLNLPFGTPLTPSAPSSPCPSVASSTSQSSFVSTNTLMDKGLFVDLTNEYRMQHFLAGLVLSELATVCETQNSHLHGKAINLVRGLLSSHDADPRYDDGDTRSRVASLYLPLVGLVLDALPQLYNPDLDRRARAAAATAADDDLGLDASVAQAISGSSVFGRAAGGGDSAAGGAGGAPGSGGDGAGGANADDSPDMSKGRKSHLSQEATRNLLLCLLWVFKNVERRILWSWWSDMPAAKLDLLLEVLHLCVSNFEYKGRRVIRQYSLRTAKRSVDMKSRLEEAILGSGSARSEMMMRRRQIMAERQASAMSPESSKLRWRKDQTQWRQSADQPERLRADSELDISSEGLLAAEATLVVMDTLELIVQVQVVQSSDGLQSTLAYVLRILLHSLALNQSSLVLQHIFAIERQLVSKFPELIFEEETEQCADLCLRLLRHCSAPIGNTRCHAAASLYLLMRQNFEIGNNFARVKMQVTMSLSSLVGQNQDFNEEHLRKSLKTILTYAEADLELHETTFPDQVRDLVFNLHMILSDTVKMKEFQEDPEMLIDLMYRIAKGYQNSPDLRLTWLQNMAAKHSERKNHAEAAQCLVHSAALVAEYLNMLEDRLHLPVGAVTFQHISRNVLEESAVSDDVVSPDEEGICTGTYFSETGLVGLLEHAVGSFTMGGLFEAVNDVYKVLIPIYEANKDYKKLSSIHGRLQDAFIQVIRQDGKRMFGTYFRVGFYGSKFGDLDGEEYIYKEPSITKLPEISHRLESFYSDKFGAAAVETIKDSNIVERDKLNPEKAYIQITYVEPYFDIYEHKDRITFFDRNYNIKRFVYATPFTMDGRAHGDLKDQYKRKTILTTSHAFPYVKTRLHVVHRDQVILCPIEVAIEDILKKTKELAFALAQEPPDPKMLQMVLQGSIGTTVNQGPLEIATVFLAPLATGETPSKHHNKLRISFKDLLKKCNDALQRNKTLIGSDQKEYQYELERNYRSVKEKLMPLISNGGNLTLKKKHKRDHRRGKSHSMALSSV